MDGYFSGSGVVDSNETKISVSSDSRALLDGVRLLLSYYGIFAQVQPSLDGYDLTLSGKSAIKFAKTFSLTHKEKQESINTFATSHYLDNTERDEMNDIVWDYVVDVCTLPGDNLRVYDLTIPSTKNFALFNGLNIRDTLNTFHFSGIAAKNVTLGVPRLKELLDVTKSMKIPSLTIYLRPPYRKAKEATLAFCNSLERTHLEDVVIETDVIYDPLLHQTEIKEDQEIVDNSIPFFENSPQPTFSKYVVRIKLAKLKLLNKNYTCEHILEAIQAFSGDKAHVIGSTANMENWIIRVRLDDIQKMVSTLSSETKQLNMERSLAQAFQNFLMKKVIIGGVKGIEKATIRQVMTSSIDSKTHTIEKDEEWVIDTEGSALSSIWALQAVDWKRTYSNDIYEIFQVLGLEAAVHVLFSEIQHVIGFDGSYINDRHIMTIVNTMTYRGYLMPLNRFGINRIESSIFGKASFEEPMDILLDAATFGLVDPIQGVSERIMVGRRADIGPNCSRKKKDKTKIRIQTDQDPSGSTLVVRNPWRTTVSASWLPWIQALEEVPEDSYHLDSPPPSPLLYKNPERLDHQSILPNGNGYVRKPFQDSPDGVAFTPTIKGKGFSIDDIVQSPNVVPMIPNARGCQLEPLNLSVWSSSASQIKNYVPSSPVMSDDDFEDSKISLPQPSPVCYNSSSPKVDSEKDGAGNTTVEDGSGNANMELDSNQITDLIFSKVGGTLVTEPSSNSEPQDVNALRKSLSTYLSQLT